MECYNFDTVIIGAGVIGLSIAMKSAECGRSTLLIEMESSFGSGTSSRNSEVIHAGIYYSSGSLKAQLSVSGKQKLYSYCAKKNIPHKRLGKYIVATSPAQAETLEGIRQRAKSNNVEQIFRVLKKDLPKIGTNAKIEDALFSPTTGIIDLHALMQSFENEAQQNGAVIIYNSHVTRVDQSGAGSFNVCVDDEYKVACKNLINSAGLGAVKFREMVPLASPKTYMDYLIKGNYFGYSSSVPFEKLIYPVPEKNGLGIHLTLDLNGRARFGPNTELIDNVSYSVSERAKPNFVNAIKSYWHDLDPQKLYPDYSGIRPKVVLNGYISDDFIIETNVDHGNLGFINLLGI